MNILEIAGSGGIGNPYMGPVTRDITELSREFIGLGHNVSVVDSKRFSPRTKFPGGVNLIELDIESGFKVFSRLEKANRFWKRYAKRRYYRGLIESVIKSVDLGEFDIIHAHSPRQVLGLSRVRSSGLVFTSHTPTWTNPSNYEGVKGKLRKLALLVNKRLQLNELASIKAANLTITLGDFQRADIGRICRRTVMDGRFITIPNGIDTEGWGPMDKSHARRELDIGESTFVIVLIGRVHPIKGHIFLLEALKDIVREIDDIKVFVIGKMEDHRNAGSKNSEHSRAVLETARGLPVTFTGFISNQSSEFRMIVSAADISVVPSVFEAQANVVLESLAMGIPVVASRVGGIPQMVPERVGCLVKPKDSSDLASKIQYLARNSDILDAMRRNCRDFVEKQFSWRRSAERHIEAFEELIRE